MHTACTAHAQRMHSACTTALPGEAELRAAWQLLEQLYQSSARFSPPEQFARVVAREMKVGLYGLPLYLLRSHLP